MSSVSIRQTTLVYLLRFFSAFWLFLVFYKFAATLHYSLLAPLGERFLPLWIVGILVGAEAFIQVIFDVPAGYLIDRFGQKRMLFVGWAAFALAALLLIKLSLPTYILSIILSAIGWLFFGPGTNAYILSHTQKETSGRFLALRDTFYSLGVVIACILLPVILPYSSFVMGLLLTILFLFAALFLFTSPPDKPINHDMHVLPAQTYHIRRTSLIKMFRALKRLNPASGMILSHSFAAAIFYGSIWFVIPLVIVANPHQQFLGIGLGIFDLAVVVLGALIGSLVDRGNKQLLVFYGLLVFTIMGILTGMTIGPLFLLFGFLSTAGDETASLSLWSWLHTLDKDHAHDGSIAGIISLSEDLGYTIGPIIAGFLFAFAGPAWAIAVCVLPIFIVLIFYTTHIRPIALFPESLVGVPAMPRRRRHKS